MGQKITKSQLYTIINMSERFITQIKDCRARPQAVRELHKKIDGFFDLVHDQGVECVDFMVVNGLWHDDIWIQTKPGGLSIRDHSRSRNNSGRKTALNNFRPHFESAVRHVKKRAHKLLDGEELSLPDPEYIGERWQPAALEAA